MNLSFVSGGRTEEQKGKIICEQRRKEYLRVEDQGNSPIGGQHG